MSMQNEIRPPEQNELRNAILLMLGGLPVGADIHFYWADGMQQVRVSLEHNDPVTYQLVRKSDGSGVVTSSLQ